MKQRLDLDSLLRKYENNSYVLNYQAPSLGTQQQIKRKLNKVKTEVNLPQFEEHYYDMAVTRAVPVGSGAGRERVSNINFAMSKSECEKLLLGLRQQLREEGRGMERQVNASYEQLLARFERKHQELRQELLNLMEHSLDIGRKMVLQEIEQRRRQVPRELAATAQGIARADGELAKLLAGLGSADYRKTIAEVVTKDYQQLLASFRQDIARASSQIVEGLVQPEPDRAAVARIQTALQQLYPANQQHPPQQYPVSPPQSPPVLSYAVESNVRQEMVGASRRSGKRKIFEKQGEGKFALTERANSEKSLPKKGMRKTFFNFGGEQY